MRFLADMGISPRTVKYLREQGHEIVHLHDEGMDESSDPEILEKAFKETRIILTSDLDFGDLLAAGGERLPSVIIFRLRDMRPDNVNKHVNLALAQHGKALEKGAVFSITENRIRVRPLPI